MLRTATATSLLLAATACTTITGTAAAATPTSTTAALPPTAGIPARPADPPPVLMCGNGINAITVLNFFFDNRCRNGNTHPAP